MDNTMAKHTIELTVSVEVSGSYQKAFTDTDTQPSPPEFNIKSVEIGGVDISKCVNLSEVEQLVLDSFYNF